MKQSLKENFVVIAGIALPILVALIFFISTKISVMGIDPPQTSVVYASLWRASDIWSVRVKDNSVYLVYRPLKKYTDGSYSKAPLVYLFNPVTQQVQTFQIPNIDREKSDLDGEFEIKELSGKIISRETIGPDGYAFVRNDSDRGGFMSEMFSGRSRYGFLLKKDGYVVRVPETQNYYDIELIGWAKP